ncbi:MAG: MarC family protein [Planctomycetota bacterium]
MDYHLLNNFLLAMLAIVNPLGKVPIWIECSADQDEAARWRLALLVTLTAGGLLLASLWAGSLLLSAFSIDLPSFRVGGGIVILLTGLSMLRGEATNVPRDEEDEEEDAMGRAKKRFRSIIVPMAVPIIAGPGSITTVIAYANRLGEPRYSGDSLMTMLGMTGVVIAVMAIVHATLIGAPWIKRIVGSAGLAVVTRLFGLVLVAIAVQLIAVGLAELFPAWTTVESPVVEAEG